MMNSIWKMFFFVWNIRLDEDSVLFIHLDIF